MSQQRQTREPGPGHGARRYRGRAIHLLCCRVPSAATINLPAAQRACVTVVASIPYHGMTRVCSLPGQMRLLRIDTAMHRHDEASAVSGSIFPGASHRRAPPCPPPPRPYMQPWEIGGGRAPRQPGQVRKEAAATSFRSGRCPVSHSPPACIGPSRARGALPPALRRFALCPAAVCPLAPRALPCGASLPPHRHTDTAASVVAPPHSLAD